MLTTFAVKSDFSKPDASRVAAVYFSFFAASRLVAAVVALKVSSLLTLIFTHGILVTTASMMTVWCSDNALVLWVGSAITGFRPRARQGAAIVAWTAEYITISNKMMSVVVVTGSIGEPGTGASRGTVHRKRSRIVPLKRLWEPCCSPWPYFWACTLT
ncbi:hypothetical protein MTO96_044473 [Rhipicephalus appendiculatus]